MGVNLRGADLRTSDFRGASLIVADLRDTDLRKADFIGADFRDVNISGADLTGSIFLTQVTGLQIRRMIVNFRAGSSKIDPAFFACYAVSHLGTSPARYRK